MANETATYSLTALIRRLQECKRSGGREMRMPVSELEWLIEMIAMCQEREITLSRQLLHTIATMENETPVDDRTF